eukprot:m51a1_g5674 hypothetical protein (140) ;mRNA; f:950485-950904
MGFTKLNLDMFDMMNLIPISIQQVLIYKAKVAECKRMGKFFFFNTADDELCKVSAGRLSGLIKCHLEGSFVSGRIPLVKIDELMDCMSDITIHIDETIAEGILNDLEHSGNRFDKKKFFMKATTKGIHDSGSNDRIKKP